MCITYTSITFFNNIYYKVNNNMPPSPLNCGKKRVKRLKSHCMKVKKFFFLLQGNPNIFNIFYSEKLSIFTAHKIKKSHHPSIQGNFLCQRGKVIFLQNLALCNPSVLVYFAMFCVPSQVSVQSRRNRKNQGLFFPINKCRVL